MSEQTEAQRLADRLDLYATGDKHQKDIEDAAAELRRLHEKCEAFIGDVVRETRQIYRIAVLEAANEKLLEALEMCIKGIRNIGLRVTTLERLEADPESFLNVARSIAAAKEQA